MTRRRNKRRKSASRKAAVARGVKADPARDDAKGVEDSAGNNEVAKKAGTSRNEGAKNKPDVSSKGNGKAVSGNDKALDDKAKTGEHADVKNKDEAVQAASFNNLNNNDETNRKTEADNGDSKGGVEGPRVVDNADDAGSEDDAHGDVDSDAADDGNDTGSTDGTSDDAALDVAAEDVVDDASDGDDSDVANDSDVADENEDAGYPLEPGQDATSLRSVSKPSPESSAEPGEKPAEEAPIEELSIKTTKVRRGAKWARLLLIIVLVLVVVLALTGVGAWGYSQFRRITVSVNGVEQQISANTSLGKLAADNDDFGAKPGMLLSVSGNVLKGGGGNPVRYTINGKEIKADGSSKDSAKSDGPTKNAVVVSDDLNKVRLPENAKITVKDGRNLIEKHDIQRTMIPFGVNVNGHGVIQKLTQKGEQGSKEVWTGKISGERVDKGVVKEPKNVIVDTFSPKPASHNVVALTFDDGPSQYSGPILDILKEKGVKATFFDVGNGSEAWPQYEKRMVAEGHQVASHSYSHPDMYKLNPDQLRQNISQGLTSIKSASGVETKMLRAPYGNFGPNQWLYVSDLIDYNVIWTIDTKDWKKPGAQEIANAALSKAYNGAVILMHDGGGDRTEDIVALPQIIDGLKGQGYEFVTIDQLMAMDGK